MPLSSPSLARRTAFAARPEALLPTSPAPDGDMDVDSQALRSSGQALSAVTPSHDPEMEGEDGITKFVWGTNISLQESMNAFRNFLRGFKPKYRGVFNATQAKQVVESGGIAPPAMALYDNLSSAKGEVVLYESYLQQLRLTGLTDLNLDMLNLLSYGPTKKLYNQLVNYPQEVVPILDHVLRDVMIELADEELESARVKHAEGTLAELELRVLEEEMRDMERRVFKIRPFGGEKTINMRDLNPGGEVTIFAMSASADPQIRTSL